MYTYIYICVHTHTRTHTHIYIYTVYIYIYIYLSAYGKCPHRALGRVGADDWNSAEHFPFVNVAYEWDEAIWHEDLRRFHVVWWPGADVAGRLCSCDVAFLSPRFLLRKIVFLPR